MFLAINEMLKEKSRFVLIASVIVLVSYLVFFLLALAYGLATSYTQAIDKWGASGIALSKGANGTITRSLITSKTYTPLLNEDTELLGVGLATVSADESDEVALFGVAIDGWLAPGVYEGRAIKASSEVVVSDELKKVGVVLNDEVVLEGTDRHYTVVGFVSNATFQTAPVVYMGLSEWRVAVSEVSGMTAMRDTTTVSAIVARNDAEVGGSGDIVQQTLRDFSFSLPGYQAQVLTFSLMIGFLIGIAAFVLAIFIYILTMQKKAVFGILKAEGVPSSYIARSVMVQVTLLATGGLAVGCGLALVTGGLLADKVPFAVNPLFFGAIAILFIVCAAIGGLVSVRSVTQIDPVEAIE